MDKLEKYITEKRNLIAQNELPDGAKERLFKRLKEAGIDTSSYGNKIKQKSSEPEKRIRPLHFALGAVAAALIMGIIILTPREEVARVEEDYFALMKSLESEILDLAKSCSPKVAKQAIRATERVTFEAIPLSEQLPEEMPELEKARKLRNYYKQKSDGLTKIKVYLAEQAAGECE